MKTEFLLLIAGDTIIVKLSKTGAWKLSKLKYAAEFENYKQAQKYLNDLKIKNDG